MTTQTHCSACGSHPSAQRPAFTFSLVQSADRRRWTCAPCAREHLHLIETGVSV